jgi:RNA recognition motif-containing protein
MLSINASDINNASPQKSALFVGDLSIFCSEADLIKAFSPYGTILETKVMKCDETNKHLCYGFVKFASTNSAMAAMSEMNGKLLCGRPLR